MISSRMECAHSVKFQWTKKMQQEFDKVKLFFTYQIRLSPYDPSKELNILTDRANSAGIGFVLYQNLKDDEPGKNVTIVAANSSGLKDSQLGYSPVDCEMLALKFTTDACSYYLYGAPRVNIFSDCSAL